MRTEIFTIHDSKVEANTPIFEEKNIETAKRRFASCVNDAEHTFSTNAADFTLFHVGFVDNDDGIPHPLSDGKINLGNGLDFVDAAVRSIVTARLTRLDQTLTLQSQQLQRLSEEISEINERLYAKEAK